MALRKIPLDEIKTNAEARLKFLEEFVGFTQDDWDALEDSLAIIGPQLLGMLDRLYEHLLSFDDTRRIFFVGRAEVSPEYMAMRKEHLTEWVFRTVEAANRASLALYLMETGRRHTPAAGNASRVVPPRYMVVLTGYLQNAFGEAAAAAYPTDSASAFRIATAWNKMLIMQLEMFLKAMVPHNPKWD